MWQLIWGYIEHSTTCLAVFDTIIRAPSMMVEMKTEDLVILLGHLVTELLLMVVPCTVRCMSLLNFQLHLYECVVAMESQCRGYLVA